MDLILNKLTEDNVNKVLNGSKGDLVRYKVTFTMQEYQFEAVYAGIYNRMNYELKKSASNIGFSISERNINFVLGYMEEDRVERYIKWFLGLFNDIIDAENIKTRTYISLQTLENDYNNYAEELKNAIFKVS